MVRSALAPENDELETWLLDELGIGAGLGLLGALLCVMLGAEELLELVPDETLGAGLGAEAGLLGAALGGGLLGELLVEECCADSAHEKDTTTANTRLEIRIKHLLPTERSKRRSALLPLTLPSIERIPRSRVKEGKD
jgi:hypothetical protein